MSTPTTQIIPVSTHNTVTTTGLSTPTVVPPSGRRVVVHFAFAGSDNAGNWELRSDGTAVLTGKIPTGGDGGITVSEPGGVQMPVNGTVTMFAAPATGTASTKANFGYTLGPVNE